MVKGTKNGGGDREKNELEKISVKMMRTTYLESTTLFIKNQYTNYKLQSLNN